MRRAELAALPRLAWRKAVHRRRNLGLWEVVVSGVRDHGSAPGISFELWGPERYPEALAANPHAVAGDVDRFGSQQTVLVVALDADQIVGQYWLTTGLVHVTEFRRQIGLDRSCYLATRIHVAPSHRGRGLIGAMLVEGTRHLPGDATIWALMYAQNAAALRSFPRSGWEHTADLTLRFIGDRPRLVVHPRRASLIADHLAGDRPPVAVLVAEQTWGATLQAARSLAALGVDVQVIALGGGASVYRRSRAVARAIDLDRSGTDLVTELSRLRSDPPNAPTVVIPCTDRALTLLAEMAPARDGGIVIIAPPTEAVGHLLDKDRSLTLAAAAGLRPPPWRASHDDPRGASDRAIGLPAILRPRSWATVGSVPWKFQRCDDAAALASAETARRRDGAQMIVQEYVEPVATWFGLIWRSLDGEADVVITGRKLRTAERDGGVMAWGRLEPNDEVAELTRRFARATGFVGLGGLEVIDDGTRRHIIEFNARLEAIAFIAKAAGTDLVTVAYRDALANIRPAAQPPRPAAAWVGTAWLARVRRHPGDVLLLARDRWAFARSPARIRAVVDRRDPLVAAALALWMVRRRGTRG